MTDEKILQAIGPRFNPPEAARSWYFETPLPGFAGATAAQLVETGRAQEVLDYLEAVDAGIFA